MTLAQVCEHSLPQLELLAEALQRERREEQFRQFQACAAAIAACWSKEGQEIAARFEEALLGDAPSVEPPGADLDTQARAWAQTVRDYGAPDSPP